jgi:hypothetical protein
MSDHQRLNKLRERIEKLEQAANKDLRENEFVKDKFSVLKSRVHQLKKMINS